MRKFKKFTKRILAVGLVAMSVLAVAMPAMAATGLTGNAVTNTNQVNVRRSGSASADLICTLTKGSSVRIITSTSTSGGWYYVQENANCKHYGYIREDLLSASGTTNPGNPGGDSGYGSYGNLPVKTGTHFVKTYVYIRSGPVTGTILGQTGGSTGDSCYVIAKQLGSDGYCWYQVQMGANYNSIIGFVRGDMLYGT